MAIFAATARVGLVAPRSTCDSIVGLTPLRSEKSRRERSMASRNALILKPTAALSKKPPAWTDGEGEAEWPVPSGMPSFGNA